MEIRGWMVIKRYFVGEVFETLGEGKLEKIEDKVIRMQMENFLKEIFEYVRVVIWLFLGGWFSLHSI